MLTPSEFDRPDVDGFLLQDPKYAHLRNAFQYRCSKDEQFFALKCLKIINKHKKIVPFKLNRIQCRGLDWYHEDINNPLGVRWFTGKPRQATWSIFCDLLIYHRMLYWNPSNAMILAHKDDASENLFRYIQFFHKSLPEWMKPMKKLDNRGILYYANPDNDGPMGLESSAVVQTAGDEDVGASFRTNDLQASECARWKNPEIILEALLPSIPKNSSSMIIFESTMEQTAGKWFYDRWHKKDSYRKIFISNVACEDYRFELKPNEYFDFYNSADSPYGDEQEEASLMREQMEVWYPEWNDGRSHERIAHEIQCRMMWRRITIDDEFNGNVLSFQRVYPTVAKHMFSSSSDKVFIEVMRQLDSQELAITKEPPKPKRYNYDRLAAQAKDSDELWWTKALVPDPYGPIFVYEDAIADAPKPQYLIATDSAGTRESGDHAGLQVWRLPAMEEVAAFSEELDPGILGEMAYVFHMIYNGAHWIPEANNTGETTLERAKATGYPVDKIYYREKFGGPYNQKMRLLGWWTDSASKNLCVSAAKHRLRYQQMIFRHLETVRQMQAYMVEPKTKKMLPGPGAEASLVICTILACQYAKDIPVFKAPEPKPQQSGLTVKQIMDMIRQENSNWSGSRRHPQINSY